jgi:rubrerythrin
MTLSAAAISMLGGCKLFGGGGSSDAAASDVKILNVALGLEHEAINAYQLGAGLLQKPALDLALLFQSHHKAHRDALISTINQLGGTPVAEKKVEEYAKQLKADTLKTPTDVLELAAKLELNATNAYLGVIPSFKDPNLAKVAARLAADETSHWTILNDALGKQPTQKALAFGA